MFRLEAEGALPMELYKVCARMREQVWFLDLPGPHTPLFSCLIWTFWPQHSASH